MHSTMYHVMRYFFYCSVLTAIVVHHNTLMWTSMYLISWPDEYVCYNKKSYVVEISEKSNQCLDQRAASVGGNKVQMNAGRLNLSLSLIARDHFIAYAWECREVGDIAACTWISQTTLPARSHHGIWLTKASLITVFHYLYFPSLLCVNKVPPSAPLTVPFSQGGFSLLVICLSALRTWAF